jgi:putative membrane protein
VSDGTSQMATGLDRLADGTDSLADGARQAANGADALADGTAGAAGGIGDLTDTMQSAVDAGELVQAQADAIAEGGRSLADEADGLADRLRDAAAGTASVPDEARQRVGELAASPVAVDASRVNAAGTAAGGLAPFLMAIAGWLGALGAFLVLPALWAADGRRWWVAALGAFAAAAGVAVAGSVLMVLVMSLLLGVQVASVALLVGFAVLSALTFTAVVQALVAVGGNRGWIVALLLLILGIAASGVPLGAAAAPGPLAILHALLPLGHAIDGFRSAITGGGVPMIDAVVLAVWLVGAGLVTLAYAAGLGRGARDEELVPA